MSKNTKRPKRDNGAGSINYLEDRKRWCANMRVGYNAKTGNPKRKAIYGKTEAEVKRKLKEFKKHMDTDRKLDAVKALDIKISNYNINGKLTILTVVYGQF